MKPLMKKFLCSAAASAFLTGCGQQPEGMQETVSVPTHEAYCLDVPALGEVRIIATRTNAMVYSARRPGNPGASASLRTFDGEAEGRVLAVTPESCQVYGEKGTILEYTLISAPLR